MRYYPLVMLFHSIVPICGHAADKVEFIDPNVIEMAPFVVYGGIIDTIDGFTEKEYHGDDPVVLGFRENFNKILLTFHRKLLIDEHKFMGRTLEIQKGFETDINAIGQSFGIRDVHVERNSFYRERVITDRLVRDPFFIIDALIVWDADRLERYKDRRPNSKYAENIRYNPETGKWERRVTTRWEVFMPRRDRFAFATHKDQGLNLDTNKGYHLIEIGLPDDIRPEAFQKVKLTYPIIVNSIEPADEQIERLQHTFIANLLQIYDPYSWIARRSTRFNVRSKYHSEYFEAVRKARLPVTDRDWFDTVLANLILDIAAIKHAGIQELYEHEMLMKIPVREHILGVGFDPLNWNPGEKRSLDYDYTENKPIWVNFDNGWGARFVMVDAYRRYGIQVLEMIQQEITSLGEQKKKASGKQIVKKVLSAVTGTDADRYIKLAEQAQRQELEKYRVILK